MSGAATTRNRPEVDASTLMFDQKRSRRAHGKGSSDSDTAWQGILTPAQITANQDDYNPSGLAGATVLRLSTNASRNITGLQGGYKGRLILIENVGANPIVLKHDVTSTAANRFYGLSASDVTLNQYAIAMLWYDLTLSRWMVFSAGSGGGGGGAPTGASYVTLATDATLTSERVLTPGTAVTVVDSGAGAAVTINHATGSNGDLHTDYAFLTGRAGGQTVCGGTAANEDLILKGTSHATVTSAVVAITSSDLQMATAGRQIQDSGGTGRILLSTASPQLTLTGDVQISSGHLSINDAPDANIYALIRDTGDATGKVGLLIDLGSTSSVNATTVVGIGGKAFISSTTGVGLIAIGLDFAAGFSVGATAVTISEVTGVRIGLYALGGAANSLTAMNGVKLSYGTLSTNLITTTIGFNMPGSANAKFRTVIGLFFGSFSNANAIPVPIDADGPARTTNTDGSVHRMNFQFGSRTRSFGTGDGVIGLANATTNPSTNPTGGGVLYSNAGAATWRGSAGTVTAFAAAGPHCGECGCDYWLVATFNPIWKSWLYICGVCKAEYSGGPKNVLPMLTREQKRERLKQGMTWNELMKVIHHEQLREAA